jgi:hypothetical protein
MIVVDSFGVIVEAYGWCRTADDVLLICGDLWGVLSEIDHHR